jgi:hypothetical protein
MMLLVLCLTIAQTTQAQEPTTTDLCSRVSTLIEASNLGFVSILGETMDEKERSYLSKLDLSEAWSEGFVYPEAASGPYLLYVSLGGNNLQDIRRRYRAWIPRLTACLRGWKRTQSASRDEVKTVFKQSVEGPSIELDYNIEPSKVGDTKYDLYLTFKSAASVVEKNFCGDLSSLINASRTGFTSIAGPIDDEEMGRHMSTLKMAAWGNGWVYPEHEDPHARYIILGGNRIVNVRSSYLRWISKLTTCLPGWKRTKMVSAEDVGSAFRETSEGPSVQLEYNREPSKVGSTRYDLYLTVWSPSATQKATP